MWLNKLRKYLRPPFYFLLALIVVGVALANIEVSDAEFSIDVRSNAVIARSPVAIPFESMTITGLRLSSPDRIQVEGIDLSDGDGSAIATLMSQPASPSTAYTSEIPFGWTLIFERLESGRLRILAQADNDMEETEPIKVTVDTSQGSRLSWEDMFGEQQEVFLEDREQIVFVVPFLDLELEAADSILTDRVAFDTVSFRRDMEFVGVDGAPMVVSEGTIEEGELWIETDGSDRRKVGPLDLISLGGVKEATMLTRWSGSDLQVIATGTAETIDNRIGTSIIGLKPSMLDQLRQDPIFQVIAALCALFAGLGLSSLVRMED